MAKLQKSLNLSNINPLDLAWAIGIIEGEGTFNLHYATSKVKGTKICRILVTMTDLDTLERLKSVFNLGILIKLKLRAPRKQTYMYSIHRQEDVFNTLEI